MGKANMTWPKLTITLIAVGMMFFIATMVNHHFYLLIAQEMRSGFVNIDESIKEADEGLIKAYADNAREIVEITKTKNITDKETVKLIESIARDLTDLRIWVSRVQEKVEERDAKYEEQKPGP